MITVSIPLVLVEDGLCSQSDPEVFFPERGTSAREAKKVCLGCPVRTECLDYALDNHEPFGIWGGLTEKERSRRRSRDGAGTVEAPQVRAPSPKTTRQAAKCGTRSGYQRHRSNGEQACGPCRQANADADRRLRNTGTTKATK